MTTILWYNPPPPPGDNNDYSLVVRALSARLLRLQFCGAHSPPSPSAICTRPCDLLAFPGAHTAGEALPHLPRLLPKTVGSLTSVMQLTSDTGLTGRRSFQGPNIQKL